MVLPYFCNLLKISFKMEMFLCFFIYWKQSWEKDSHLLLDITIIKMETIFTCKCGSKSLRQIYANGWFVISLILKYFTFKYTL